jgi:hypothetical protein
MRHYTRVPGKMPPLGFRFDIDAVVLLQTTNIAE